MGNCVTLVDDAERQLLDMFVWIVFIVWALFIGFMLAWIPRMIYNVVK